MARPDPAALWHRPVVVAPMAGGPSTPRLVAAAGAAGALGLLAGGYRRAADLADQVAAVRAATAAPFGVNLFVPGPPSDPAAVAAYVDSLAPDAAALGVEPGPAVWGDDAYEEKLDALLADPVPLVTFTFGCPDPGLVDALHDAGSAVGVTVTDPAEARTAEGAGADLLFVQGPAAGAHRATFANGGAPAAVDLLDLVAAVAGAADRPVVAGGGVDGPRRLAEVLGAGAVAGLCGTAFLRCPESGTHPVHRAALARWRVPTAVTRAFTGRPARGLVNRFMLEHPDAPAAYPEIHHATRPLRAAAAARGDADRLHLWAGEGYRSARELPAAEVVALLCGDRS